MQSDLPELDLLPQALRECVLSELDEGEELLWCGQPIGRRLARQSLPIVLFAIPWTAFAIFWMCGAAGFKVPNFRQGFDFFPLFGVPFVLVGVGMFLSPFWALIRARRMVHMVTDQRVVMLHAGRWKRTVESFEMQRLPSWFRREFNDGTGDLVFRVTLPMVNGEAQSNQTREIGLLGIRNVRTVEGLLRQQVRNQPALEDEANE